MDYGPWYGTDNEASLILARPVSINSEIQSSVNNLYMNVNIICSVSRRSNLRQYYAFKSKSIRYSRDCIMIDYT